eukprot:10420024-Lingulodinium_polyedra.AAC.1
MQEALSKMTKKYYEAAKVAKSQQQPWHMHLLSYTAAVDPDDKIPSRHKPTFVKVMKERMEQVQRPLSELPLVLTVDKELTLDWSVAGIYSFGQTNEEGF